jgi:predicted lipase
MPVDLRQEALANFRTSTRTILDALDRTVRDRRRCQILSIDRPFTDEEIAQVAPGLTAQAYTNALAACSKLNDVLQDQAGNPTASLAALETFATGPGRGV